MRNEIPEGETFSREFLANERTLLSWIRVGVSAITLGILLDCAGHILAVLLRRPPGPELQQAHFTAFAVAIVCFGIVLELLAAAKFIHYQISIGRGTFTSSALIYLLVALGMVLLSVAYVIYALLT